MKSLPFGVASLVAGGWGFRDLAERRRASPWLERFEMMAGDEPKRAAAVDPVRDEGSARLARARDGAGAGEERLRRIRDFDRPYPDDFVLAADRLDVLASTSARLEGVQELVGHGNFNLLSFDSLLRFASEYSEVGAFGYEELRFLEEMFFTDAKLYGFLGDKVLTEITAGIPKRDVKKIAGSGHYLFRGESLEKYQRIRADIGETITLTSGVRGLGKQFQLFLRKAVETGGNLSQASRSLAPPGYSYHARGDFDIGRVGLGSDNFTEAFAGTDEYKKMIDLGYVDIRYTETNPFGVRHEPWHVKIG